MKITKKYNLCFKQSKCNFDTKKIPILEVVVGQGEVQIENNKIKAVKKWKTPTKIKEVKSFLGFANFYQYFIKNFSHTVKPLINSKKKRNGNGKKNIRRNSRNSRIKSQVNQYLPYQREKENSE